MALALMLGGERLRFRSSLERNLKTRVAASVLKQDPKNVNGERFKGTLVS